MPEPPSSHKGHGRTGGCPALVAGLHEQAHGGGHSRSGSGAMRVRTILLAAIALFAASASIPAGPAHAEVRIGVAGPLTGNTPGTASSCCSASKRRRGTEREGRRAGPTGAGRGGRRCLRRRASRRGRAQASRRRGRVRVRPRLLRRGDPRLGCLRGARRARHRAHGQQPAADRAGLHQDLPPRRPGRPAGRVRRRVHRRPGGPAGRSRSCTTARRTGRAWSSR